MAPIALFLLLLLAAQYSTTFATTMMSLSRRGQRFSNGRWTAGFVNSGSGCEDDTFTGRWEGNKFRVMFHDPRVMAPTGPNDANVMTVHFVVGALVRENDPAPNWTYAEGAGSGPARRELVERENEHAKLLRFDSTRDILLDRRIELLPTTINSSDLVLTKRQNGLVEKLASMTAQFQYHLTVISPSGEPVYISEWSFTFPS